MPIDPQMQSILDHRASLPAVHTLSVADARAQFKMPKPPGLRVAEVTSAIDRTIPGPSGPLGIRVYTPLGRGPFPALVFFHGGGFVVCDLDTHDPICRNLCSGAHCVVVAVDYRLAPEHRFPAASDDCLAATRWVAEHAAELNAEPVRLAVGGDSAGGNLATVTAQRVRAEGGPRLLGQLLIYPATDGAASLPPPPADGETGFVLKVDDVAWYRRNYLSDLSEARHPHASPLRAADLRALPPALVILAEYDALREEGERYAERLQQAGVPTVVSRYDGVIHGFFSLTGLVDKSDAAVAEACAWLRSVLGRAVSL